MDELKRVPELRVDEFSKGRLIENQNTINELTSQLQELQDQVNCITGVHLHLSRHLTQEYFIFGLLMLREISFASGYGKTRGRK